GVVGIVAPGDKALLGLISRLQPAVVSGHPTVVLASGPAPPPAGRPAGGVGSVAPGDKALLGLISRLAPAVVSGNTTVVLASGPSPLPAVTLGEVLATSDGPGRVGTVLPGLTAELVPCLPGHMDVNALDVTGAPVADRAESERLSAENVKRVVRARDVDPFSEEAQSPYEITALMEFKTVWHPMGAGRRQVDRGR